MNFIVGEIYKDRDDNHYEFIERHGGVTIFINIKTGERVIQHMSGRFRWDDIDTSRDIIGKVENV